MTVSSVLRSLVVERRQAPLHRRADLDRAVERRQRARAARAVAPEKSFENAVRSSRNGCWTRNDAIPVSIVDGDLAIERP